MNRARRRRRRSARAWGLVILLSGAPAAAQEETVAGVFAQQIGVEVVDVDVIVSARDGKRILDLAQDEFELLVDGKAVPIEYFAAPRVAANAEPTVVADEAAPEPAEPVEPAATFVVYVDQAALLPRQRDQAVAEIRAFVQRKQPEDVVIVAAFEERLHLIAPPSAELAAIDSALDRLLALPVASAISSTQRSQLDNAVRGISIGWAAESARRQRLVEAQAMQLEGEIRVWAERELERQRRSIAALEQLIGVLGTLEGRKSVVLATGGSTTESAEALLSLLIVQRLGPNRLPPPIEAKDRVRIAFEEMVRSAQDARVALYTVSPGDRTMMQNSAEMASPGRDSAPLPRDPAIVDGAGSVARMAGSTGGRVFLLGRDLDQRLENVRADLDSIYTLGFLTGEEAGFSDHRIEVRVARQGLSARHRESYRRQTAAVLAGQALLAAASLGRTENPLGISLTAGAARGIEGKPSERLIPVELRVPYRLLALLPEAGLWRGRVSIQLAIRGRSGTLFQGEPITLAIDVPDADRERALAADWVYRAEVRVDTRSEQIAFVLLDRIADIFSTASTPAGGQPSG